MALAGVLRIVLGDQLSPHIAALADLDPARDVVLMAEVQAECTYVKHHPKKILLVLSAMRHFAAALRARGVAVDYIRLDDPKNTHSLRGEMLRAAARHAPDRIVATQAGEWRLAEDMRTWHDAAAIHVEIRDDLRFFARLPEFFAWARDRRTLRMEFFYRDMRRRHGYLMQDGAPSGGKWNFDAENRKRLPATAKVPPTPHFEPDEITREVMALVRTRFADHYGSVDGFRLPVTARDAREALTDFIANRLPQFGDWQDAMKIGEPRLFHSLVSTSLNIGLLDPREICDAAQAACDAGHAPLNAVEGFIRQILGWREFIRGIYWLHMPQYATRNALDAHRPIPEFYWSGNTKMNCLHHAITESWANAYGHHIQRLMITGNFALLAGLDPDQVDAWYMEVYADAYEWVEMPNTRGMAIFADGGIVGSKPYAASGAYINRMSNYCGSCHYDVRDAVGERACPFNYLYWEFFAQHRDRFAGNPRLAMPLKTLERMDPDRLAAMRALAKATLGQLAE